LHLGLRHKDKKFTLLYITPETQRVWSKLDIGIAALSGMGGRFLVELSFSALRQRSVADHESVVGKVCLYPPPSIEEFVEVAWIKGGRASGLEKMSPSRLTAVFQMFFGEPGHLLAERQVAGRFGQAARSGRPFAPAHYT
jgi:hypothetical protein